MGELTQESTQSIRSCQLTNKGFGSVELFLKHVQSRARNFPYKNPVKSENYEHHGKL